MGEFEFRHYPSPRQFRRKQADRDIAVPIDGPLGHRLFRLAEETSVPFEIHYEVEDDLLPPLEKILAQYPRARVIWCHLAQIRYQSRSSVYGPEYVRKLLETHPNLYFDTALRSRRGACASSWIRCPSHRARSWPTKPLGSSYSTKSCDVPRHTTWWRTSL